MYFKPICFKTLIKECNFTSRSPTGTFLCEDFSPPDENCSADNDACKNSSNNGWMNCRGDLGDNPSCGECGDGYVRGTEECDDGNTDNFDECSNDCVLNSPGADTFRQITVKP